MATFYILYAKIEVFSRSKLEPKKVKKRYFSKMKGYNDATNWVGVVGKALEVIRIC